VLRFSALTSASRPRCARITPLTSPAELEVLKDDKRAIFSAAAHAQRAVDYLQAPQCASQVEPLAA
jgi:hypothetical protein